MPLTLTVCKCEQVRKRDNTLEDETMRDDAGLENKYFIKTKESWHF